MTSKIVVNNIESDSGISSVTFTSDIELGTKNLKGHNLESTGIVTAVSFTGSGANLTNLPAGNLSGTLPALDGSALTGVGLGTDGSANTSGIITATAFVPTTQQLSHRNIIINGDFRIAQRGYENSYSSTANGYKTVDRWAHYSGSTGVTVTSSQQSTSSSDTPYQNGFSKFFRFALSGAGTANADAYLELVQKIEAQDIANSGWNFKSSSSNITLSFWLRASTNQTFHGFLKSYDGTQYIYAFSFTASGNNTWTKITKTIPGNSNLQFDNNNQQGLQIVLVPFYGTDYTNNRTLNTWTTVSTSNYFPDMASTWLTAGASTWDVTGFQLEVGPVATPFEHLSYAEQFRQCARYCYQWIDDQMLGFGQVYSGSGYVKIFPPVPVNMRAKPSVTKATPTGYWFVSYQGNSGYAGDRAVTVEGNSGSELGHSANVFRLFVNGGSNQGNGTTVWCLIHDSAGAYLRLEAEL